jgi:hypothetical protein
VKRRSIVIPDSIRDPRTRPRHVDPGGIAGGNFGGDPSAARPQHIVSHKATKAPRSSATDEREALFHRAVRTNPSMNGLRRMGGTTSCLCAIV